MIINWKNNNNSLQNFFLHRDFFPFRVVLFYVRILIKYFIFFRKNNAKHWKRNYDTLFSNKIHKTYYFVVKKKKAVIY